MHTLLGDRWVHTDRNEAPLVKYISMKSDILCSNLFEDPSENSNTDLLKVVRITATNLAMGCV